MTLTRKILLALLGLTLGTLAIAAVALYPMVQHHTQQLVGARFEENLVPTARAVDNLLLDALRGMYLNIGNPVVREGKPEQIAAELRNVTYVYPYLKRIYLADPHGQILASSDAFDVGHSAFESPIWCRCISRALSSDRSARCTSPCSSEERRRKSPCFSCLLRCKTSPATCAACWWRSCSTRPSKTS